MMPAPSRPPQAATPSGIRRRGVLPADRRRNRRYPIAAEVQYTILGLDGSSVRGTGRSINLSTGGILFQSEQSLRPGMKIELAVAWPVRLNNALDLNWCVSGRVSRTDGKLHAVRIREYEFCLRGRYRLAGPRFREAAPVVSWPSQTIAASNSTPDTAA